MPNLFHVCFSEQFTFVKILDRSLAVVEEFHLAEA